ncbi:alpha-glucosidase [Hymenobacter sp. BT770]|uniref:glycoside hydrolase family 13 protein n=1 Tax=Hymenobacter sp. BT770 TaxID=2886942 RepID=UPI001D10F559|nr:alpha-glucosidase [Hymenobacter sp. BT770]MCC3153614.1 alpha-glucosidase [Hymenobacter sp. BT770]MDO3415920.1 alpha-glucosidase [Hymenobacter sp. BT770]
MRNAAKTLSAALLLALAGCGGSQQKTETAQAGPAATEATKPAAAANQNETWWKEAVVYQVYPRSYQDSNGDGVGDLRGLISRLDYIKSLGVNVIWLNPIFGSPNDDNGYDISDYRAIMKDFGTMQDFDELLKGMHQRGLKVVLDLVVNHSSDEHEWFKQARSSRTNPYRDYYHWWPAEKGTPNKRQSFFDVKGDAWAYDPATKAYYLHYFSRKQPDLNWENPKLREEIYSMMRFWFDKGIDGFRMDVIPFISKDTTFPPLPAQYHGDFGRYYANGPHLHEYLQEMNREALSKYDVMSVAEGAGVTQADALQFVDPARKELNMLYHFEGMGVGLVPGNKYRMRTPGRYSLLDFKRVYTKWDSIFARTGWGTVYLGNHDQPRMTTRWGDDRPEFRAPSSKLLTTFLLTMRGTPYYYGGDELGMTNIRFTNIKDYQDIETRNMYAQLKGEGGDLTKFLAAQQLTARDNGRTPFQWDATANAGFTTGKPWLTINPNYAQINAAAEEKDPNSILNYFRKATALRRQHKVLVYGQYQLLDAANPNVYAYTRTQGNDKVLVVLNFTSEKRDWTLPTGLTLGGAPWLNNYPTFAAGSTLALLPWQALVLPLR